MRTYALSNPLQHDTGSLKGIHEIQRALKTDHFYFGAIDGIFGAGTAHASKTAKWHLGYPSKLVLPTAGQLLHDYLTGAKHLPPSYVVRRHLRGYGIRHTETVREKIIAYAMWGVAHELEIHYGQVRPMPISAPYFLPMLTDCSGFATLAYKVAGASDPNGLGYSGQGYTGTLLDHGVTIPLAQAKPGDLVIWGVAPGHHVAIIVGIGLDPMIVSHGGESGPLHIKLSDENAAQNRPYVVRRYLAV